MSGCSTSMITAPAVGGMLGSRFVSTPLQRFRPGQLVQRRWGKSFNFGTSGLNEIKPMKVQNSLYVSGAFSGASGTNVNLSASASGGYILVGSSSSSIVAGATSTTQMIMNASGLASLVLGATTTGLLNMNATGSASGILGALCSGALIISCSGSSTVNLSASASGFLTIPGVVIATLTSDATNNGSLTIGGTGSSSLLAGAFASTVVIMNATAYASGALGASATAGKILSVSGSDNVVLSASGSAVLVIFGSNTASITAGSSATDIMMLVGQASDSLAAGATTSGRLNMSVTGSSNAVLGAAASGFLVIPANATVGVVLNALSTAGINFLCTVSASGSLGASGIVHATLVSQASAILTGNAFANNIAILIASAVQDLVAGAEATTGQAGVTGPAIVQKIKLSLRIQPIGIFTSKGPGMIVATPTKQLVFPGCSQVCKIVGIQDTTQGTFWDQSAAIQGTLIDSLGNPVAGCTSIVFIYIPGSNGDFLASFGDVNFQPEVGTGYTFVIDGVNGASTYHAELVTEVRNNTGR